MTTLEDLPLRDDLRGQQPYGAPQMHVPVELNVNENTFGIPAAVAADIATRIAAAVPGLNRYPDREFTQLRTAFAEYLEAGIPADTVRSVDTGLSADNIWAANGSNEVLQQILQAFGGPGRSMLSFAPTYSMYPILSSGTETQWVPLSRERDYTLTAEHVEAAITEHEPDLVFLCSPNNPTGTAVDLDVIAAAYEATDGIVVVDEAYKEFEGRNAPTALSLLPGRARLIVSRTMSKAFAFAGARVGYLAADPAVTDALRLVRLPYHLSALTQAAALAALAHAPEMLENVDRIIEQRDRIVSRLHELGFSPYKSASNFVMFGGVADVEDTFHRLLERGVIIRDNGIPHCMRVTAGTEAETTEFLTALADVAVPMNSTSAE